MRHSTLPLYAGGFLGPFGGSMLVPLIPTIAASLDTSVDLVAVAITAYMVPFAAVQLVSGTLAERLGGGRVVRIGYVAFALAWILAALAPGIWTLLGARALAGTANAFLTPVLLAALSETVHPDVLGRSVGTFAAVQTAALTFGPLVGGAFGELSWRLAFGLIAVVSLLFAIPRLELRGSAARGERRATFRALLDRWVALVSAKAFTGYLGFTAIGFLVALVAESEFGLGAGASGLVVAAYGAGGILLSRLGGTVADRAGRPQTALAGGLVCAAGVLGLAFAPSVWVLALVYLGIGCASAFAWPGVNTMAVEAVPENRAGAVSVFGAFKFAGTAVAPLLYVPLFHRDTRAPFLLATVFSALFVLLIVPWLRRQVPGGTLELRRDPGRA